VVTAQPLTYYEVSRRRAQPQRLHVRGDVLSSDTPTVDGKTHSVAGEEKYVAVAVDRAGVGPYGIKPRNLLPILVQNLRAVVDLDPANRPVAAGKLLRGVKYEYFDRAEKLMALIEMVIVTFFAKTVVLLHSLL
jgi:hypothetical protein